MDITFSSWLSGITVYLCLDTLRQKGNSAGKIDSKKLKSLNLNAFEYEVISLPVTERLAFVLHDLEKYTAAETSELLLIKTEEMKKYLDNAHALLKNASSSISQVTPLNERISSLSGQIVPGNEVWKNISLEVEKLKASIFTKMDELNSDSDEETKNEKQERERKFNIFGWKKK